MTNTTIATTAAVVIGSFAVIKTIRTKRALKANQPEFVFMSETITMRNEETGATVTVHRDFANLTSILDHLK